MTRDRQSAIDDIAYLRELTQDTLSARAGAAMITVGVVFAAVTFAYWLMFSGRIGGLATVGAYLWMAGVVLMVLIAAGLNRRLPPSRGAASRGLSAAWGITGCAMIAPCLGWLIGGARIGQPHLVLWVFPALLFTLYGAAWIVAWVVRRRAWFGLVGAARFAAAFAEGALAGSADQWLVLSAGLVLLVAAPGAAIVRQARAAG
jgi:hypothetical protein